MMKTLAAFWAKLIDPRLPGTPDVVAVRHLPSLDGLRGFSILIVIFGHLISGTHYFGYINGLVGVDIFFVISGFLITTLLLKEKSKTGTISLKGFYTRRVLRIFPVAYLYLLVLVFLNAVFLLHITPESFFTALLYIKNFAGPNASDWQTGHFWTLGLEEQFYLLFPVILVFNFRLFVRIVVFLILAVPLASAICFHWVDRGGQLFSILHLLVDCWGQGTASILWGSLTAILLFKGLIPLERIKKFQGWALFLLVALVLLRTDPVPTVPGIQILALCLFSPGVCLVIVLSLRPGASLSFAFFNNRILSRIGVLSYSLYVWQEPFTQHQPWAKTFVYGSAAWFNLPALGVVACLSYYCFERPIIKLKDRITARPDTPGALLPT